MNEIINVIYNRRSIRKYKPEQITDAEVRQIIDCALYAPNAGNQQKWHFTVIQNKDMLDRMVNIIKKNIMSSGIEFLIEKASTPDYNTFHNAPTVILVTGDEKSQFVQFDCGAAAQNIALAAKSLHIASCITASSGFLFASEEGKELRKELGIPDGYNHICAIAIGYKDCENPDAPTRNKDVISYIT